MSVLRQTEITYSSERVEKTLNVKTKLHVIYLVKHSAKNILYAVKDTKLYSKINDGENGLLLYKSTPILKNNHCYVGLLSRELYY